MTNYVIPDIVQKFSGVKVDLWNWLEKNIGNQDGPFEINQSKLAEELDVSRKSIQNALKTFRAANLVEKVESRTGRGNHPLYQLIWTFREEGEKSATPSRVKCKPQEKSLTKGRQWRYFAYKFRTLVEDSSLSHKSQVVVGKILNYLEGKPPDLFQETLTYLKRWLSEEARSLKGFFAEFYHEILQSLARSQRELEETKQFIQSQREQREQVREQYENNPPPKSSDFARFADYLEAMDEWEEDS
ncbi:helix-turn-helix domain-containing protein [Candidatus Bipolaricaulota bacterium]|nr:helix-turn-helix domain-containing protein [Candidatus Bipolaricaulota bacterium]